MNKKGQATALLIGLGIFILISVLGVWGSLSLGTKVTSIITTVPTWFWIALLVTMFFILVRKKK